MGQNVYLSEGTLVSEDGSEVSTGSSGPLTSLLPLGKLTSAGPSPSDHHVPVAALFNPSAAAWDDATGGWVAPVWQSGHVSWVIGVDDLNDDTSAWAYMDATPDTAQVYAAQYQENGFAGLYCSLSGAQVTARATTAQNYAILTLADEPGHTFLQVLVDDGGGHTNADECITFTGKRYATANEVQTYWSAKSPDDTKSAYVSLDVYADNTDSGYAVIGVSRNGGQGVQLNAEPGTINVVVVGEAGQTNPVLDLQASDATHVFEVTGDKKVGFFNATPVTQRTGVAVTAAGIHAALVSLGLITA